MKIWLDTINLEVIADAAKKGIVSGITTNPSILSKAKKVPETLISLLELQNGPVAVQVTAEDPENMIIEAKEIFGISNRMIIKIPVNSCGLIAMHHLRNENIPILGTGIFHPSQALLAANQGATYLSPYYSHIGDIGDAYQSLKQIAALVQNCRTKVLAASLRNLEDIVTCALLDIHAVTIKEALYYKLISEHPLLEKSTQKFQADWKEAHGNISIKNFLPNKEIVQK